MCTNFFSSLFLHKERDNPDTGKGPLHYFREIFLFLNTKKEYLSKIPFPVSGLSHGDVQKKKRKKIGGLRSVSLL